MAQIIEYFTPNNTLKHSPCPSCGAIFTNTYDLHWHRTNIKCYLRKEISNGWKKSKKNGIEWNRTENVPNILKALRESHNEINGVPYWLYGDSKFVARKINC